ncbi:alpha/beta hydrolase [Gordonia polyisoprenivorans]|uniref:alpha/beta hydrolase n=1 Tax=Gordonia polyisoprenivorans TaxID=84595 RepID=UPI001B8B816B|nr:alpha/beta hydrolase [Gordonia polyisoprenivorans]QUD84920.1 alpha/beta hydrolase [Gordonia polyisoprenivorans]
MPTPIPHDTRPDAVDTTGFHPDLTLAARLLPRTVVTSLTMRPLQVLSGVLSGHVPDDVEVAHLGDGVSVRLHRPNNPRGTGHALLWIHGGGYVIGTAAEDDALCRKFADRLGIPIAAVDYRLAPAHPYPVPVQDCHRGLDWLATQDDVDPEKILIGGASAGGGLAAALALRCRDMAGRDSGSITPVFQLLVYPMLDDRTTAGTGDPKDYRVWSPSSNRLGWASYLGGADRSIAVPARRADLTGLPPAWIGVGTRDLFFAEDLAYSERLRDAGVPVTVDTVPGGFHAFDMFAPRAAVSESFFDRQCEVLNEAMRPAE